MRLAAACAAVAFVVVPSAEGATTSWSSAREIAGPRHVDLQRPTVAISPSGRVTIGYGVTPQDASQDAYAELIAGSGGTVRTLRTTYATTTRPGHGSRRQRTSTVVTGRRSTPGVPFKPPKPSRPVTRRRGHRTIVSVTKVTEVGNLGTRFAEPERVPTAERVLALGTLGGQPELLSGYGNGGGLTGDTADGVACCTEAGAQARVSPGLYAGPQPLTTAMDGGATGTLVPEANGALAVIAGADGIWTTYGSGRAGFRQAARELAAFKGEAPTVAAGPLAGGRGLVVWTEPRTALNVATRKQRVYYAVAPAGQPAGARRLALTVPAGYSVSQVAVARHGGVASIAWVENWLDVRGRYHSRVYAADLKGGRASGRRVISPVNVVASQISFAGTGAGPELLAWQACAPGGLTCKAQAALRPDGGGWGPVRSLGEVDPGDAPLAAMTTAGTGLVDWISEGDVRAVCAPRGASGFAAPAKRLDRSGQAAQLTLSTGPLGTAVAAWTDGVMAQSLHAALYRPPRLA